ncbi:hypothetical protein [Cellvibrio japonicus]|uniref:hypothetical protein n=1 Tax=Cellvibrio japonicus TaxID=155077 RepID=UPI000307C82C|nr:hypothetical protein [Cellvibrio japonicus]QEI12209.1 hypothetical protein FY117_08215 [Cellvibrio japonicus]QEI15783.1 hypothetical protein FY116_08220 [Cellvibrio japonicus]QEI19361.1 hypothetical protein FY115_08215 [Cellvibrio japonicus]
MGIRYAAAMLLLALTTGCSTTSSPPSQETPKPHTCPEQRPQICTMEFNPVCAKRDTGIRCVKAPCPSSTQQTFSNACMACADPQVISYRPGSCEQQAKKTD